MFLMNEKSGNNCKMVFLIHLIIVVDRLSLAVIFYDFGVSYFDLKIEVVYTKLIRENQGL